MIPPAGTPSQPPQQMIVGQTAQYETTPHPYTGPQVVYGPPSEAAKVIGILLMVYGGFNMIAQLAAIVGLGFLSSYLGEDIYGVEGMPSEVVMYASSAVGMVLSGLYIYAGYLMMNYKKKGIYFAWGILGIGVLVSAMVSAATPEEYGGGALGAGIQLVVGSLCAGVCGLILAIPLFIKNNGME